MSKIDSKIDQLLDRLAMLQAGNAGNKQANFVLEDCARSSSLRVTELRYRASRYGRDVRIFIPPKDEDRVIMFPDNSGVYFHADGFLTPMGEDISHEVHQWEEVELGKY